MITDDKTKRVQSLNSFVSVIVSWLERRFLVKTFEENGKVESLEDSIQEIRQVLDE